jgi:hypothetical protein
MNKRKIYIVELLCPPPPLREIPVQKEFNSVVELKEFCRDRKIQTFWRQGSPFKGLRKYTKDGWDIDIDRKPRNTHLTVNAWPLNTAPRDEKAVNWARLHYGKPFQCKSFRRIVKYLKLAGYDISHFTGYHSIRHGFWEVPGVIRVRAVDFAEQFVEVPLV